MNRKRRENNNILIAPPRDIIFDLLFFWRYHEIIGNENTIKSKSLFSDKRKLMLCSFTCLGNMVGEIREPISSNHNFLDSAPQAPDSKVCFILYPLPQYCRREETLAFLKGRTQIARSVIFS